MNEHERLQTLKVGPSGNARRRRWPHAVAAALCLCTVTVDSALGGTAAVLLDSEHVNQLSNADPLEFERFELHTEHLDAGAVRAVAKVSTTHHSTFQDIEFEASATLVKGIDGQPILLGHQAEKIHLWGEHSGRRWISSMTGINSHMSLSDAVTWSPSFGTPVSWQWVVKINASFSQKLDIEAGQSPLYRLSNQLYFLATANGAVDSISVGTTTYDPDIDADPPLHMWSELRKDVDRIDQPVAGFNQRIEVLRVDTEIDLATGDAKPINLAMFVDLTTHYNFLNDGTELNYELMGEMSYDFNNSAEVLGFMAFDAKGNVMADLQVESEAGFQYRNLGVVPEPSTWALFITGLALMTMATRSARRSSRTSAPS